MPSNNTTEAITVQATKESLAAIDALAKATDRSRDEILDQAIDQFLATNAWQIARIEEGLAAERGGATIEAESVFAEIAARHGWDR